MALAIAGVAGSLVLAGTAGAVPSPPGGLGASPASPTQSHNVTVSWSASTPDPGESITDYVGGVNGAVGSVAPGAITLPDGAHTFSVRAVQSDGQLSDPVSIPIVVDNAPPTVTVAINGTPNAAGWYRDLQIVPTCTDPLSPPVGGCAPFAWTTDGTGLTAQVTGTDAAGNAGVGTSAAFKFDTTAPTGAGGLPSQPGPAALVAAEPVFSWTPGVDVTSGPGQYELQVRNVDTNGSFETIARVNDAGGVGDYSARRDPALRPAPLPQQALLEWRVRTIDRAGNANPSSARRITIDSTIPPAPDITGGPSGPIRFASPTFSWNGTQDTYLWDLTIPGRENPVRAGGGPAKEVTLQSLADGPYTFRVSQVTPFGQPSAQSTRAFVVDTTPPVAPSITARPPFPASGTITFGWTQEPGAFSRWQIIGAGGAVVIGPTDTPLNSVSVANLADGAYSFQVLQVDAAGNASAMTSEPFTVTNPLAPGEPPSTQPKVEPEFLLPTQNAFRLRPKAGRTVPTRRPVLRWRKGPRGTRLYNVQIFKVVRKRRGASPTVKKVYSGFPAKRQLRAPKSQMKPGTCYVWRVWPYTGTKFTPKPLGISNFCVAKASVLKKKAAQAAAKRRAAQRRAR